MSPPGDSRFADPAAAAPLALGDGQSSGAGPTAGADRADPAATPTSDAFDCRRCGACCASYRVSFYWAEAEVLALPDELVEQLTPWHACLAGTQSARPRCRALHGEIGDRVCCTVYPQRPSPCHEVQAGDERCQRARWRHGLPPLAAVR
ncbi:MAG: Flagellin N-methylase [Candidatus Accumulibacter adjunctus]|uniref:Flagellin N-methylase n=1 Tax=Candidatus Accumulibacter adjunctus TaxID=1454001 RepID=A0A011NI95_9PROT|nr:MAG: Flagellin N-methylase [Candidatus Accumulibacter adjunctus]